MLTLISEELDRHFAMAEAMRAQERNLLAIARAVWTRLERGGCLFAFGNGGSAAEAQHFCGELVGRYRRDRRPLAAHALAADGAALTCIGNDYAFDQIFSRQVSALCGPGDVVAGFSTSGTSKNVIQALEAGRTRGALTLLFTGEPGAEAAKGFDHGFVSPSTATPRIQEMHQLAMHVICALMDEWAISREGDDVPAA